MENHFFCHFQNHSVAVVLFAVVKHGLDNFRWWDPVIRDGFSGGVSKVPVVTLVVVKVIAPGFDSLIVSQTTIHWEGGDWRTSGESSLGNDSTDSLHVSSKTDRG